MSSPEPDLPRLIVRRKRASTKTLLGSKYEDTVTEVYDPPFPENTAQDYNETRLKEGLKYADSALRNPNQKLSPLGMRAIYIYKNAITSLLDLEQYIFAEDEDKVEEAKEEWLAIIRGYEESAQYRSCLLITNAPDAQKLLNEIVNLQRIAFFARYGDLFALACKRLRTQAEAQKVLGWKSLVGSYWTEIRDKLEQEKTFWEQLHKGKNTHNECPTYMAISCACRSVGFNTNEMIKIIELYITRNEIMHSDMDILIKKGQFHDLAKILYEDFCDIPRVISAIEDTQVELLTTLLEVMIDHWFIRSEMDPDNIQMWVPTEELKAAYKRLQDDEMKAEENKFFSKEITRKLAKRMREKEEDKMTVDQVEKLGTFVSGSRPQKRVASSDFERETKRAKEMNKAWNAVVGMSYGLRKLSDTYIANYGSLERPPEIVHDPTLD